jgi:hypothetical protein
LTIAAVASTIPPNPMRTTMTRMSACALALLICAPGCGKSVDPAPASSAAPSASAAPPASATTSAASDDAAVGAAVNAVIDTCTSGWRPGYGFESKCPALQAFTALKIQRGASDAFFVHLLDDPSEKARSLGARGLAAWGGAYVTDKALAERVIAAASKETSEAFTGILGNVAGHIDAAATGLGEPIKGLVLREGALQELQVGVISSFLPANVASDLAFDLTREMAKRGPSTRVRNAAVSALSAVYDRRGDEVCAIWKDTLTAPEELPAANAASRLTTGASWIGYSQNGWSTTSSFLVRENRCAKLQSATLAAIEARAKSDKLVEEAWVTALTGVFREELSDTPPAEKKRALAVARALVTRKEHSPTLRGSALRFIARSDPEGAAFVARFVDDPDTYLKTVAAGLARKQ